MANLGQSHSVAVVIHVYNDRESLPSIVENLQKLTIPTATPNGLMFSITEVVLVFDCGTDGSEDVLRALEHKHK